MVASTPQPSIVELLKAKALTRSAEIIPPRNGSETDVILRQIERLKQVPVDFISVTKGAGGSLRGGTLPIAQLIKSRFDITALAHFTCRDYTIEEIENTLMDHHYFGVHNILALRGDPPEGKPDHFKPAPNRHSYAYQLVDQIRHLNGGEYIVREGFDKPAASGEASNPNLRKGSPTSFCIGVAAHPEQEPHDEAVEYFARKVENGAQFAITQMLFSAEPYARFLESCAKRGIHAPVLPGLRIVTQLATAERMTKKKEFGIKIPQAFMDKLASATSKEDGKKIGFEYTLKLCEQLVAAGAPGIHVFVMNDENSAAELLLSLKS
ncbi:MAG: methylenetetrahydrofolate reductase [Deltaproteobacteria bacterium]|nr:methylenetetrahydrofolate reductase [Deltaproteobacteria bacterium]